MGNSFCYYKEYFHYKAKEEISVQVDYKKLKNNFNEIQKSIGAYFKDIEEKNNLIQKYQSFLEQLNIDLNQNLDKWNISIFEDYRKENNISDAFDMKKNIKLKEISDKINDFKNIIEDLKNNTFKRVENLYGLIQTSLTEYKYNDIIGDNLKELEEIKKKLKDIKDNYESKNKEIQKEIEQIQSTVKKFAKNSEIICASVTESLKLNSDEVKLSTRFLKNSMLLDLKEYLNSENIFNSRNLFKDDDNNDNQESQKLLRKNWCQKCYIYEDYDLHDVNYELKAVGLPSNACYNYTSFPFYIGILVEIIEFDIDGEKADYEYENFSLKFKIIINPSF